MTDNNYKDDVLKYGEDKAKKIHELQAIIVMELQKNESEINHDLIDECVDWCLELKGINIDPTNEELDTIYNRCISTAKSQQKPPARSLKRTVLAILAAALFLAAMCITAVGIWGHFDSFVDNVKDLFKIKPGDIISTSEGDLTADKNYKYYDNIMDFYNDTSINVLFPEGRTLSEKMPIVFYSDHIESILSIKLRNENFLIVYISNPPYDEEVLSSQNSIKQVVINSKIFYLLDNEQDKQYIMFDKDFVYIITASGEKELSDVAKNLQYIKENN